MSFVRGNGGTVKLPGSPATSIPVGKWTCKKVSALANTTNSTSSGRKNRKATVKDSEGTFSGPWDNAINAEESGFTEGATIDLLLKFGTTTKSLFVEDAVIESVEFENDEDEDVTRFTCVWKGCTAIGYGEYADTGTID